MSMARRSSIRNISPAPSAGFRCRLWNRGCSLSTTPCCPPIATASSQNRGGSQSFDHGSESFHRRGAIGCLPKRNHETIEWNDFYAVFWTNIRFPRRRRSTNFPRQRNIIIYGPRNRELHLYVSKRIHDQKTVTEGLKARIDRLYLTTKSEFMKEYYGSFMSEKGMPDLPRGKAVEDSPFRQGWWDEHL